MKNRIKELREHLGLSQREFGEKIGSSRDAIAGYERGVTIKEPIIQLICRTYKVNQDWIRYGDLPMFKDSSADEEIAEYIGNLLSSTDISSEIQKRLIHALSKLDDTDWKVLEKIAENLLEKNKKNSE